MNGRCFPSRRRVLQGIAAVLVATIWPEERAVADAAALARAGVAGYTDLEAARQIGCAWLSSVRVVPTLEQLVAELAAMAPAWPALMRSPHELRRLLAERVREDFARGSTIAVDGWVLARTEVVLCGVAARTARGCSAPEKGEKGEA